MQNRMTSTSISHPNQTQNAREECTRCGESGDSYYNRKARNQICFVCNIQIIYGCAALDCLMNLRQADILKYL